MFLWQLIENRVNQLTKWKKQKLIVRLGDLHVYLNPFIRRLQKQSFFPDTPITSLKTKKGNFWTKCQCSMVSWLYMETKTFRGVLCTQMTCQNQINLLAVFSIWKGYLHMMNMFIGQSEMVFFRFFQRLVILGAVPKGS